jgi:hypothetical protein
MTGHHLAELLVFGRTESSHHVQQIQEQPGVTVLARFALDGHQDRRRVLEECEPANLGHGQLGSASQGQSKGHEFYFTFISWPMLAAAA